MSPRPLVLALLGLFLISALPAQALGTATKITVTPSTLQLTADQSVALTVTAIDAANQTADVTGSSVFSTTDPRASIVGATFAAGKAGTWNIGVTYQGLTATVPVTVTAGALAELTINPSSGPEVVALNKTMTFTATGFDAKNNQISKPTVVWSTTGSVGSVSSTGLFTPSKEGTGTVVATAGAITTSTPVKVVAARITNANTNTATNSNANTNSSTNDNTNAPSTTNLNVSGTTDDTTNDTPKTCTAKANWLWGILLLALLGGVAILYAFVPVSKTWPAMLGIALAVVLSVVERSYGCSGNAWWPWIAILGTAGLTVFAYQQAPRSPQP